MKVSNHFKETIKKYLDNRAGTDPLFAVSYAKPNKNLDECINYILNTVQKSGCNGFADEEIYGMAVHYFDEDNIDKGSLNAIGGKVVVNHHIELTEEEKQEQMKKAKEDYYNECLRKQREQIQPKVKVVKEVEQASLF